MYKFDASSTERREGNKGNGRTFEYGNLHVLLFRRFLCETGVHSLIPSRSGVYRTIQVCIHILILHLEKVTLYFSELELVLSCLF